MGFDMYWVTTPPEIERQVKDALKTMEERSRQLRDENRPMSEVAAIYENYDAVRVNYFRLNIAGMRACAQLMNQVGMLRTGYPEPQLDDDVDFTAIDELDGGKLDTQDDATRLRRKHAETQKRRLDEFLRWGPGDGGLPAHKFGSDDGWIVTPEEIKRALKIYDDGPGLTTDMEWWPQWIEWLRSAVDHDGIEVR